MRQVMYAQMLFLLLIHVHCLAIIVQHVLMQVTTGAQITQYVLCNQLVVVIMLSYLLPVAQYQHLSTLIVSHAQLLISTIGVLQLRDV